MTDDELAAIRSRYELAHREGLASLVAEARARRTGEHVSRESRLSLLDVQTIFEQDVPALLAEVERQREMIVRYRRYMDDLLGDGPLT